MRQIIFDTETTGLDPRQGHRLIEIGCLELMNRRPTGNNFHAYLNPQRDIPQEAINVHGLTPEFLADKPLFAEIAESLKAYLKNAELIAHNAPFDIGFLDTEFRKIDKKWAGFAQQHIVTDTVIMARKRHPGQKNNLDALCKRYDVDNSQRQFHGALLDAQLLAEVYLKMTGGQSSILLNESDTPSENTESNAQMTTQTLPHATTQIRQYIQTKIIFADAQALTAHEQFMAKKIKK